MFQDELLTKYRQKECAGANLVLTEVLGITRTYTSWKRPRKCMDVRKLIRCMYLIEIS